MGNEKEMLPANESEGTPRPETLWTKSPYNRDTVILLCCLGFLGISGVHRMYVGKLWTGILWFLTAGLGGIGTVYDLFCLFKGYFEDSEDRRITAG